MDFALFWSNLADFWRYFCVKIVLIFEALTYLYFV